MCPCIIINQSNFPSLLLWHLFSDEVLMTTYQSHGITALPNDTDPILRPNPTFFLEKAILLGNTSHWNRKDYLTSVSW